jgi:transposase
VQAGEVETSWQYSAAEVERMMKLQDVLLKAMAKKISWADAGEIIGVTDRTMRRWRERLEEHGYDGLADRRKGRPSPKRVPLKVCEEVLRLYQERYADFNVRHFHEKLREEHGIELSYTWVKRALQGAGLVKRCKRRGVHRRRRARRPLPGMLLHIDGSQHQWFQDERWYDLVVILDDATSEIYYAQLVEEEATRTVMAALWEVVETQGLFCALYSDRAGHFFRTPKAGEAVDKYRLTQVGRALRELGIQMIPAYSPQARGRSERSFGTWQGRLPQELRLAGIVTVEGANQFLRDRYIAEFNRKFAVPATEKGSAFRPCGRRDLEWVFSVQNQRVVAKDNTVTLRERAWQLERSRWRCTLAGCTVTIHEHLNGTVSVRYGPHLVGRFTANGAPLSAGTAKKSRACGKVEISQTTRDSHFPTATTTTIPSLTKRKTSKRAA